MSNVLTSRALLAVQRVSMLAQLEYNFNLYRTVSPLEYLE